MNISFFLVILFTFLVPVLTPYGYKFISYADPFLLARDYIFDLQKDRHGLKRLWVVLVSCLAFLVVLEIFNKEKVAVISLCVSIVSETLDYLLTRRFINNKIRPFITVFANFMDAILFVSLCYIFKALGEFDYNIFLDFLVMNVLYLMLFLFRWSSKKKKTEHLRLDS